MYRNGFRSVSQRIRTAGTRHRSSRNSFSSESTSTPLRQFLRRNFAHDTRCAVMSEVNAARVTGLLRGVETNIPRGWDDGISDDDGG